jgi:uncharacterized spore protein YtfJ
MSEPQNEIVKRIEETLDRLSIRAAFGEPVQQGEVTIIPVAQINLGFGFGHGSGGKAEPADGPTPPEATGDTAAPGGAGGGGGGGARPLGYIQFDTNGAHFEPILDITRMGMAGILMVGWAVFWFARALRRGRR